MAFSPRSIRLTRSDAVSHVEAVSIFDNYVWTSPAQGWLQPERGRWQQLPQGLFLLPPQGNERVAELQGCNVFASRKDDVGSALYNTLGVGGNWKMLD